MSKVFYTYIKAPMVGHVISVGVNEEYDLLPEIYLKHVVSDDTFNKLFGNEFPEMLIVHTKESSYATNVKYKPIEYREDVLRYKLNETVVLLDEVSKRLVLTTEENRKLKEELTDRLIIKDLPPIPTEDSLIEDVRAYKLREIKNECAKKIIHGFTYSEKTFECGFDDQLNIHDMAISIIFSLLSGQPITDPLGNTIDVIPWKATDGSFHPLSREEFPIFFGSFNMFKLIMINKSRYFEDMIMASEDFNTIMSINWID